MSYEEVMLIKAEAKLKTNDAAGAKTDMTTAITASINLIVGARTSNALSEKAIKDTIKFYLGKAVPEGTLTMKDIVNERYVTLFMQTSTYNDIRRLVVQEGTGANDIYGSSDWLGLKKPATANNDFPKRLPPPVDEETLNEAQLNVAIARAGINIETKTDNSAVLQIPIDWEEKAVLEESTP
jgi:hypothetical protein